LNTSEAAKDDAIVDAPAFSLTKVLAAGAIVDQVSSHFLIREGDSIRWISATKIYF
jgi:hypothetical protein